MSEKFVFVTYRSLGTALDPSLIVICNYCGAYVAKEDQHKHTTRHKETGTST